MSIRPRQSNFRAEHGSVLVIVLWIAFGLVAIALYFGDAMSAELRASDSRVAGVAAAQAIDGAARYISAVLSACATNGVVPDRTEYQAEAVPVGTAHFWIIGRDHSGKPGKEPYFALIDEGSKLNLNHAGTNAFVALPNMTSDFAQAILDWRSTNSTGLAGLNYAALNYVPKNAPFETVDELRLVSGSTMDLLAGTDLNRNGILDGIEIEANHTGQGAPGIFEYVTAFSREPNLHSDGTPLTNVNTRAALTPLLQQQFGTGRSRQILSRLFPPRRPVTYNNLLQFYLASGLTSAEFARIAGSITASSASYIYGRVNINTANAVVLGCLPNMDAGTAQQLVNYRQANSNNVASIAWIVDALGATHPVVQALARGDYITTRSYQFTADVAALGPYGRGYRRTKFIFDLSAGSVQVVYRQDLSRLGWALGKNVHDTFLAKAIP